MTNTIEGDMYRKDKFQLVEDTYSRLAQPDVRRTNETNDALSQIAKTEGLNPAMAKELVQKVIDGTYPGSDQ